MISILYSLRRPLPGGFKACLCLSLLMGVGLGTPPARAMGLTPVPVLKGVQVQARASFAAVTGWYTYTYTVSNPVTNTGEIGYIWLDMTAQSSLSPFASSGLTVPVTATKIQSFDQALAIMQPMLLPAGTGVIPFGQRTPGGWVGGLRRDGFGAFSSDDWIYSIKPGSSLGGLELISGGVPTIRAMEVDPDWIYTSPDEDTPEEEEAVIALEKSLTFHTVTLGPSGAQPGSFNHWDQVRDDLNKAIGLGWIPDVALGNTLVTQLAAARTALDASDGTLAKSRLGTLLAALTGAAAASRRQEAYDLVFLNAQSLVAATPDTPIPFEPKVTFTPSKVTLPLGAEHTLTATAINLGDGRPLVGFRLRFSIVAGPHSQRFSTSGFTDSAGKLTFSYTGKQPGTDTIKIDTG